MSFRPASFPINRVPSNNTPSLVFAGFATRGGLLPGTRVIPAPHGSLAAKIESRDCYGLGQGVNLQDPWNRPRPEPSAKGLRLDLLQDLVPGVGIPASGQWTDSVTRKPIRSIPI